MLIYNIGISAIRANQVALQTISNNIANANTDGYHRQRVQFTESNPFRLGQMQLGTGVQVDVIQRLRDALTDNSLTLNLSQNASAQTQLSALQSIEALLNPTSGSLQDSVAAFFNQAEQLSANPGDGTLRLQFLSAAQDVARSITSFHASLGQLQQQLAGSIQDAVRQVNSLTDQIADLNQQIQTARAAGTEPSTLLDHRDALVQQLAQLVDINPTSLADESSDLVAAGGWLVVGKNSPRLSVQQSADGSLQILFGNGQGPVTPVAGKLAGLLEVNNHLIPQTRSDLQEWTSAFVSGVNSLQATGMGLGGPVSELVGSGAIADPTVPLAQANSLFPIGAGDLYMTVTNAATGSRTTSRISIDPSQDSLQDVISRINSVAHVHAAVTSSGKVRLATDPGYGVDFAGRPDAQVDASSITGTSIPTISGISQAAGNARWVVSAASSGQIGVTDGLKLRVTDSVTGDVIKEIDVGSGYQANQPIEIADGVFVQLPPGTLNSGDIFQVDAIGNPDTSGFLSALGLGVMFQTSDLKNITVNEQLASQPDRIAAGRTGSPADGSQINRLVEFRSARVLTRGTETLEDRLASLISNSGVAVNSKQAQVDQLQAQFQQLRDQQDSVSGVDPNEELLLMLQFQRSFQANSKFLSSVNDALDSLLQLVR